VVKLIWRFTTAPGAITSTSLPWMCPVLGPQQMITKVFWQRMKISARYRQRKVIVGLIYPAILLTKQKVCARSSSMVDVVELPTCLILRRSATKQQKSVMGIKAPQQWITRAIQQIQIGIWRKTKKISALYHQWQVAVLLISLATILTRQRGNARSSSMVDVVEMPTDLALRRSVPKQQKSVLSQPKISAPCQK